MLPMEKQTEEVKEAVARNLEKGKAEHQERKPISVPENVLLRVQNRELREENASLKRKLLEAQAMIPKAVPEESTTTVTMTNGVTVTTDRSVTISSNEVEIHIDEQRKCAKCREDAKSHWKSNQFYCEKEGCKKARDNTAKKHRECKKNLEAVRRANILKANNQN